MFIIKFNKMIHNKLLWGIFATIVVVAFAGSDLISGRRGGGNVREGIGVLDGEDITFREYDLVKQQVRMELQDRAVEEDLDDEVWQRLAELRQARKFGLTVADEEVMDILRRDPAFAGTDGRFDPVLYRTILENALMMTPDTYQAIRRNQILLSKLESAVASAAWGVPSVAEEQGRGMTDRFTVRVVHVSNTFAKADVPLDDVELEAFYRERLPTYRIPERVSVRYVAFPVAKYRDQVKVDEDDARDYYDAHVDRYQVTTNDTPTTLTFEEARGIVENELRMQGARELAGNAAAEFADIFYAGKEDLEDGAFERLAVEQGYSVATTGLFSADQTPTGIDGSSLFVQNAFDLDGDSSRDRFSDAVVGLNTAYVLALQDRQEARDPAMSEIADKVRADAVEFNRGRLFAEHVDKLRGTVATEMDKDRPFDEILSELGLKAGTNLVVTAVDAYRSLPGGKSLATQMMRMSPEEVSPAVFVDDGAVFLQVVAREAGEALQQQVMAEQMVRQIRSGISELVRDDWRRYTLASMNLVTARRTAELESEDTPSEP